MVLRAIDALACLMAVMTGLLTCIPNSEGVLALSRSPCARPDQVRFSSVSCSVGEEFNQSCFCNCCRLPLTEPWHTSNAEFLRRLAVLRVFPASTPGTCTTEARRGTGLCTTVILAASCWMSDILIRWLRDKACSAGGSSSEAIGVLIGGSASGLMVSSTNADASGKRCSMSESSSWFWCRGFSVELCSFCGTQMLRLPRPTGASSLSIARLLDRSRLTKSPPMLDRGSFVASTSSSFLGLLGPSSRWDKRLPSWDTVLIACKMVLCLLTEGSLLVRLGIPSTATFFMLPVSSSRRLGLISIS